MSVSSAPNAVDVCTGKSANILQHVRAVLDAPSSPNIGLNIQVVTRSEGTSPMTQTMTATCSRSGGCDLDLKWSTYVCSSGLVDVTFAFANGGTSIVKTWFVKFP